MKIKIATALTDEQQLWLAGQVDKLNLVEIVSGDARVNPCVRLHGLDPQARKCKDCALLLCNRMSKNYYKCELRGVTHGAATDHKVNWPACAKFEERKP
jgi:hypothetical protein